MVIFGCGSDMLGNLVGRVFVHAAQIFVVWLVLLRLVCL